MSLYAVDDDDLISACEAEPGKIYWCVDCFGPVKRRRGKSWLPHFYHLNSAPTCRLYSKTEDHFLAQIQLEKQFPKGAIQLERPFIKINRVADACWEREKIAFEIQCSPITEGEVEGRERDYQSIGYEVVWLLDDKRYNKRVLRPAEESLRKRNAYYICIQRGLTSECYDQFEVFAEGKRLKRGKSMRIDLQKIRRLDKKIFSEEAFPKQITQLRLNLYFQGSRMERALQGHPMTMQYWRGLEIQLGTKKKKSNRLKMWFSRHIGRPYLFLLNQLIKRM